MTPGTDRAEQAKAYFKRPGFKRLLASVWKKYESLGRIGGHAVMERVTPEECEAVNAFFGWNFKPGDKVSVPLALFEAELRASRFALGLVQLHDLLEGKPLLTNNEKRNIRGVNWSALFADVRESMSESLSPDVGEWLARLENGGGSGTRILREQYQTDPKLARETLVVVIRALQCLFAAPKEASRLPVRLPVLAARVSGDAHALDMDRPAGRMLAAYLQDKASGITGRAEEADQVDPGSGSGTLQLRETYRKFGILDDDLSSVVHWFVPAANKPVLPQVWTLRQVDAEEEIPGCSRLFIVENPSVFSTILDSIRQPSKPAGRPPALICTSGPASAAAIRWIRRCLDVSGPSCMLYYSGDFDVKGLSMGQTLYELFPDRFRPWRFDHETYMACAQIGPAGPLFDDAELDRLDKMITSWDERLCGSLRLAGRKVHQELIVDGLVRDYLDSI